MASDRHGNIHSYAYIEAPSMFNLRNRILDLVINVFPYLNSFKNPVDILKERLHNLHNLTEKPQ